MEEKKRRPWIGFIGLLLLVVGLCVIANNQANFTPGCIVGSLGAVILVFAVMTGNVKILG